MSQYNNYLKAELFSPPRTAPVLIFNANSPIALTILRSLCRRNVSVDALFGRQGFQDKYQVIVRSSRHIRRQFYFSEEDYDAACLAALTAIAKNYDQKAVLIPLSDRDMLFLSVYRETLSRHYLLHVPAHDRVVALLNKIRFARLAAKYNLPIPETYTPESAEEIARISDHLIYPCILKPDWRQTQWDGVFRSQKVVVCQDARHLAAQYQKLTGMGMRCLVQEIIPGSDDRIYCVFGVLDEQSRPLAVHVCKKLRQSPPLFGNTALAESVHHLEVESLYKNICNQLGLTGYISIEFKKDERNGCFKIVEITPARPNRQLGIAVAACVDIPFVWYRWLAHAPVSFSGSYKTGIRWVSEVMDLRCLPSYVCRHHTGIWDIIASYARVRQSEILSFGDMVPFLMFLAYPLMRLLRA